MEKDRGRYKPLKCSLNFFQQIKIYNKRTLNIIKNMKKKIIIKEHKCQEVQKKKPVSLISLIAAVCFVLHQRHLYGRTVIQVLQLHLQQTYLGCVNRMNTTVNKNETNNN